MKKWVSSIVSVTLALSLAACSKTGGGAAGTSDTKPIDSSAKPIEAKPKDPVTIRITFQEGEMPKDQIAEFEQANPDIKISREDIAPTKLAAELAANEAPDIIKVNGLTEVPSYVIRGVAMDLTSRFQTSTLLKETDFLPVVDVYRFDGKERGKGSIYGFPKDWSPDFTLWINKKAFEAAKVPLPDPAKQLTWEEILDLSKKLTIKNGDTYTQYGFVKSGGTELDLTVLMHYLLSKGVDPNSADFSSIDFTKPEVKEFAELWNQFVQANVGPNSVNNFDKGIHPNDIFTNGKAAMTLKGYWFSGAMRDNEKAKTHLDDFIMLPPPIAKNGKFASPTGSATGAIINKKTKHPDEAWKVFEWFFGGKPAEVRAKSGYGVPALKHLVPALPQGTSFDKQTYQVLQDQLKYTGSNLSINPYLLNADSIIGKDMAPYYFGKGTLDESLANITKDANNIIKESKSAIDSAKK
ncbi:ABC transporter substrate-binding protein [Paenibacillus roseipurpureus]|uniref:Extracellular solute-binding protein n=1 Tax=Paenibacillus roseopurpureus TaxID=2918901 RepID=A0AA96LQW2_9BACL|nr:extracellular solute-binding protein [Paenibacillus sp. MBLB1832]WNR45676.1 extracellular solute-binding protein [Paenibacillus sp. MBLB1832]